MCLSFVLLSFQTLFKEASEFLVLRLKGRKVILLNDLSELLPGQILGATNSVLLAIPDRNSTPSAFLVYARKCKLMSAETMQPQKSIPQATENTHGQMWPPQLQA